jgi:release factor glutamine methyltransferase
VEEERGTTILDIGTGSGCIACTLAAELPEAQVTAWDISEAALSVARENAKRTNVHVSFEQVDALNIPLTPDKWDIIISNPPYICEQERATMERHVLDYEPSLALFVPDDDPLLFYRAIADYARQSLTAGGSLFFEINPLYAEQLKSLLSAMSYHHIEVRDDQYGKPRMIKVQR